MFLLLACKPSPTGAGPVDTASVVDPVAEVVELLSGRFDSSEQASINSAYYAVSLVACPVEVPELGDSVLYVEQALVDDLERPYRQRYYVLDEDDEGVRSVIYELDKPKKAVGFCDGVGELSEGLLRPGCDVVLEREGDDWVGGTDWGTCESTRSGSSFATSEVFVTDDRIESWDRGWTTDEEQAWGAVAGAYVFLRVD